LIKERPAEAPFILENSFISENLQRTAGIVSYKLSITALKRRVISSIDPIPFTA
jgi:hypothetical protein